MIIIAILHFLLLWYFYSVTMFYYTVMFSVASIDKTFVHTGSPTLYLVCRFAKLYSDLYSQLMCLCVCHSDCLSAIFSKCFISASSCQSKQDDISTQCFPMLCVYVIQLFSYMRSKLFSLHETINIYSYDVLLTVILSLKHAVLCATILSNKNWSVTGVHLNVNCHASQTENNHADNDSTHSKINRAITQTRDQINTSAANTACQSLAFCSWPAIVIKHCVISRSRHRHCNTQHVYWLYSLSTQGVSRFLTAHQHN